jgi:hypothetical protein
MLITNDLDKETNGMNLDILASEYSNRGLIEILGPVGVGPFTHQMEKEPADAFVRGVMIRAGRAGFYYWLKQEGDSFEKADPGFNLSPVRKKIATGLAHFSGILASRKRYTSFIRNHEESWELELSGNEENQVSPLECDFVSGFIQEFASWAGMGKLYQVSVNAGSSGGKENFSIIIKKQPVE